MAVQIHYLMLYVFHLLGTGPMSDYNSNALIALQGELVPSLNVVMEADLNNRLEMPAGGFMTRSEAQSVRNAKSPMGRLIEILLSKGDKEFNTFCDMLERSNNSAWADRLRQRAREGKRAKDQKDGKKCGQLSARQHYSNSKWSLVRQPVINSTMTL